MVGGWEGKGRPAARPLSGFQLSSSPVGAMSCIVDIIKKKRDGHPLTEDEINAFVNGASQKTIHDSQIGAMLMAIFLNGMNDEETFMFTKAVIDSGEKMSWSGDVCDKHSTGGVGDKISIILAPALAANGLTVPMMSGRGLDFTGGTLDKLESIPGFRVELNTEEMEACLERAGFFIAAATSTLCPADSILYAIRDITGTVDSSPLITASILGKKYVGGARNLVLDLKVGSAAFIKTVQEGKDLANKMITVAEKLGMKLKVVLTRMSNPLGHAVGNSLEIKEALDVMKGGGPHVLKELTGRLGGELLFMAGKAVSYVEGYRLIVKSLDSGTALEMFEKGLLAQGVDPSVVDALCHGEPWDVLPLARNKIFFKAPQSGFVESIDGMAIAIACRDLGGGRTKPKEQIDYSVGVYIHFDIGSEIQKGDKWLTLYFNKPLDSSNKDKIENSIKITDYYSAKHNILAVLPE